MIKQRYLKIILSFCCAAVFLGSSRQETLVEFDFGRVNSKQSVRHTFTFSYELAGVLSLCECIKTNSFVQANGKGQQQSVVQIVFDPAGYQGAVSQDVIVLRHDGAVTRLRVRAMVEAHE